MIKLNVDPMFTADVEVTVPGQVETGTLSLTFKYMPSKDFVSWMEKSIQKTDADGKVTQKGKTKVNAFLDVVSGWGLPEEYTEKNVGVFLENYPRAYEEIFEQYSKLLFESRVKN